MTFRQLPLLALALATLCPIHRALAMSGTAANAPPTNAEAPPTRLTFDVASIRLSKADNQNGGIKPLPGGHGYTSQNIPIKLIISLMYKVPMRQINGGPDWLATDRYDIEARVDGSYSVDDLHIMFQNLLADRFGLKFHIDTREGNVYALTVDPAGIKMKPNDSKEDFNIPMNFAGDGSSVGVRVPMVYLTWFLGQQLQRDNRPVIDQTGLTGFYDFKLTFLPPLPPDLNREDLPANVRDRPSIQDAVRDQLGLRLTQTKGPIPYYVIDSVERPTVD